MEQPAPDAPRVLVPLAPGFEEIEAVTIIDVLRRAHLEVCVAGSEAGVLTGSRGIRVEPDTTLDALGDGLGSFDAIVLPGGMGGTLAMMEHEPLLRALREQHGRGAPVAAICAAPMVLARAGIEEGLRLTSHPGVRERLGRASVEHEQRVVRDGQVWTSQGPGTAMEFSLALVEALVGPEEARALAEAMVVQAQPEQG